MVCVAEAETLGPSRPVEQAGVVVDLLCTPNFETQEVSVRFALCEVVPDGLRLAYTSNRTTKEVPWSGPVVERLFGVINGRPIVGIRILDARSGRLVLAVQCHFTVALAAIGHFDRVLGWAAFELDPGASVRDD
ncbi:MAG: hypothetical protein AAGI53_01545 [Planctomycetota bacterium]